MRWSFLECDGGVTSSINRMKDEGHFSWISGQKKYTFLAIKAILSWRSQMAWIRATNNLVGRSTSPGFRDDAG